MKLLVLGANGQLGSDILREAALQEGRFTIIAAGRKDVDISSLPALAEYLGGVEFDALINCTSYHKTDEVEENGSQAVLINAHAVQTMARACRAKGARFFHYSTDYVFGGNAESAPLKEDARPAPVNVYGASKLLGESLARLEHDDVTILRVASLFGVAGASGKGGNFVETMIRVTREKGAAKVVNDQIMSPTSTREIARWTLGLLAKKAPAGLYHAVNSGSLSWYEFTAHFVKLLGIEATVGPITAKEFPTRASRPSYSALDNSKLAAALGGEIRSWQEALREYLVDKGHLKA